MGPTCEVTLDKIGDAELAKLNTLIGTLAERVVPTRKGKVWDIWIRDRPIHVAINQSQAQIELSAGCNAIEDREILKHLASAIAQALEGLASEPE